MLTEVGSVRVIERAIFSAAAAAAAAALTLSAAAPVSASGPPAPSWPQPRYGAAGTGYNPNETQLSVHNVSKLVTRAATPMARPVSAAAPVIADGLVIVTGYATVFGQPGEIEAFPETCGAPYGLSCPPVWTAVVSYDDSMGVTVADGKVFANTLAPVPGTDLTHQKLWVFSVHCGTGGAACAPLWTTTFPGESDEDEAPVVAGGVVYVPHGSVDHSFLYALPASCSPGCRPLWRGRLVVGADDSAAVADGFVYMHGGRTCSPLWHRGGLALSDPTVAGGEVWAAGGTGLAPATLYAFGLPVPGTPRRGR